MMAVLAVVCGVVALMAAHRPGPGKAYVWQADLPDFGGISGLQLSPDGATLYAVSDAGYLVRARVERGPGGAIRRISGAEAWGFLNNNGQKANSFQSDAEAVRLMPDGRLAVAFESYTRVATFNPPDMRPLALNLWSRFRGMWDNESFEALAVTPEGAMLALVERPVKGHYRSFRYQGGEKWTGGPGLATDGAFMATDADFGPDGRLYVLERNLSLLSGYTTRISAYAPQGSGFGAPAVMLQTQPGDFGDFEGMDVWQAPGGEMIATLVNDSNFMPDSATVVAEFPLGRGAHS